MTKTLTESQKAKLREGIQIAKDMQQNIDAMNQAIRQIAQEEKRLLDD